ncbi:MAG: FAD-dependent oxidoreductase [Candidatus Competibacteraceae bacterium]|nr:FAD-dependent oxidoreductase [Candidatus Competibacteraceae bacterium]MCB1814941.1 FAD-dependent oxidoreductase [Candidatus Competibacteraceae bacterium]
MSQRFPHLFSPLPLRHLQLKHRLNFGAHTANMAEDGLPGERHLGYYAERARGGAAMLVVEPMPVHRTAVLTRGNFRPQDDTVIPHFQRITEACHAYGAIMIQQLYHAGQHGDWDNSFEPNWSPSGLPSYHDCDGSHAMSEAQIEELIDAFVQAARRAQAAGFDGIELFAAYHALIDQFWTPWSNRRTDCWGGSLANRCRFSAEIIRRIRRYVGEDFIIGLAVSVDPDIKVALSLEALCEIIAWHDQYELIDYVSCGTGSYFGFHKIIPTFPYPDKLGPPFAEALKQAVKHAKIQAESHIRTPENADYVIASGQADMVSIVRGQIADPQLANKAQHDRPEDIRPCISCNQMCWGRRHRDYWISCLVNPSAGREFDWGGDRFATTTKPRRILVVGAGPAGLEAARVAAERGHHVTLAEAAPQLGGQFRLAGLQPRRGQVLDLLAWYETQLQRLAVDLRLNTMIEADDVATFEVDTLIIASGALPSGTGFQRALPQYDSLPGLAHGQVWSVEDVMQRSARLGPAGTRLLLLDDAGHWRGCGTAWYLAEQGYQVCLVTPQPMAAWELVRTAADFPLRQRLAQLGVVTYTDSALAQWHGDGATLRNLLDNSEHRLDCAALVLATPPVAETSLLDELADSTLEWHAIGDCVAPRRAHNAIFEGRRLALSL